VSWVTVFVLDVAPDLGLRLDGAHVAVATAVSRKFGRALASALAPLLNGVV